MHRDPKIHSVMDLSDSSTRTWYQSYVNRKGTTRNDLLRNPEVVFQTLAYDASVIGAVRSTGVDPSIATVLDVGCGGGASLVNFVRLGFQPSNLYGIDLLEERIQVAKRQLPGSSFQCLNAAAMSFGDDVFDVVFECGTLFVQPNDLSSQIAAEMVRVVKPGGFVLLADWRYAIPGDASSFAMSRKRIARLFGVGSTTEVLGVHRGSLVPPIGRLLSTRGPSIYFLVQRLLPFLVGQVTTVLRKTVCSSSKQSKLV